MQQGHDMMDALRTGLAGLATVHSLSGSEQSVIARLREVFTPLTDTITTDRIGNLMGTREGPQGSPYIVVSAHADEIGAVVANIESDGFLRLLPVDGVQAWLLEGRAVWVNGRNGVIGTRSGSLTPETQQGKNIYMDMADLYVDLRADDATQVEALGVHIGDPVIILAEQQDLAENRIAGKGVDNRAGCAVLLQLLRRLHRRPLHCCLTVLVAVQGEIGGRGMAVAFAELRPDLAIVIDTFPAAGTPDARNTALSKIEELVVNPPSLIEEHVMYHSMPKDLSDADNLATQIGTIVDEIQKEGH